MYSGHTGEHHPENPVGGDGMTGTDGSSGSDRVARDFFGDETFISRVIAMYPAEGQPDREESE